MLSYFLINLNVFWCSGKDAVAALKKRHKKKKGQHKIFHVYHPALRDFQEELSVMSYDECLQLEFVYLYTLWMR